MADIKLGPFGGHDMIDETTDETFPLITIGGDIDDHNVDTTKHETSFGGAETSLRTNSLKNTC